MNSTKYPTWSQLCERHAKSEAAKARKEAIKLYEEAGDLTDLRGCVNWQDVRQTEEEAYYEALEAAQACADENELYKLIQGE